MPAAGPRGRHTAPRISNISFAALGKAELAAYQPLTETKFRLIFPTKSDLIIICFQSGEPAMARTRCTCLNVNRWNPVASQMTRISARPR